MPSISAGIITGLALAAALLLVLWLRGWPLLFVILLVAALGLWEFYSLFWGPRAAFPAGSAPSPWAGACSA